MRSNNILVDSEAVDEADSLKDSPNSTSSGSSASTQSSKKKSSGGGSNLMKKVSKFFELLKDEGS